MTKRYYFHYSVRGRNPFPIDMLRYDFSVPRTEESSHRIAATMQYDTRGDEQTIELTAVSGNSFWGPTAGRWESFGWDLVPGSFERKRD